jgi:uncharacterized spore protein YtfJ
MALLEELSQRLGSIADKAGVETIFGQPKQAGDVTVIPIGRVAVSFGIGGGKGKGQQGEEQQGEGEGGGTGGRVTVTPVAVLEVRGDDTYLRPVIDENRIIKYVAIIGGILAFWFGISFARLFKKSK